MLVIAYESNSKLGSKMKLLIDRITELWHGKKEEKTKKGKKDNSVVKVSQPISRAGMPTHQASRADYLNSHNMMVSPTQMLPPANEQPSSTRRKRHRTKCIIEALMDYKMLTLRDND